MKFADTRVVLESLARKSTVQRNLKRKAPSVRARVIHTYTYVHIRGLFYSPFLEITAWWHQNMQNNIKTCLYSSIGIYWIVLTYSERFLEILASTYAPGPYLKCTLLQEHVYAFQIWSWSIFNLEYSSRLLMVQDHKVLMVQDHKSRPKSQKSILNIQKLSKTGTLEMLQYHEYWAKLE